MTIFDFSTLGGAVASIVTLAVLLGAIAVLVRASYRNATNEQLRKVNEDLRDEITDVRRREEEHTREIETLNQRVRRLEQERDFLRSIPNEKFQEVVIAIEEHHREVVEYWTKAHGTLEEILLTVQGRDT